MTQNDESQNRTPAAQKQTPEKSAISSQEMSTNIKEDTATLSENANKPEKVSDEGFFKKYGRIVMLCVLMTALICIGLISLVSEDNKQKTYSDSINTENTTENANNSQSGSAASVPTSSDKLNASDNEASLQTAGAGTRKTLAETGVLMRPTVFSAPDRKAWNYESEVYVNGARQATYSRNESIAFPVDGAYTAVEGVITFRSGNFRNNASYGTAALSKRTFTSLWNIKIGSIDSGYAEWSGVGWTGQPVLVRWDKQTRSIMNLKTEFKNKSSLIEVIYGTLDGNIYFLDAETGKYTREPINLGFPIKGSVSVDPRGYPLLYVGQGISVANGVTGDIGWYIYSLIDGRRLFFLDGRDKLCYRKHGAFDGSCLIDAKTDTAVIGAENGILYTVKLNTYYNPNTPTISVKPVVTALRYKSADIEELGFECSVAACGQYAFLADNSGLLTCFDLNTLEPAWFFNLGDDTDSTITLEADGDRLWLYTVNEVDKQGDSGVCTIRKLNALTGEQVWSYNEICTHDGTNGGGGFASPVLGANEYADYIYFNLCRTTKGGKLYCFDKRTGRSIWQIQLGSNSWSSPVIVYRKDGTGVLILAGGKGELRMYNPLTGDKYSEIMLEGKIEASPAVFGDILVIGTRGKRIYGIRLS